MKHLRKLLFLVGIVALVAASGAQGASAALTFNATEILTDGNFTINGVAGSVYTIGAATTTGTITIGGTAQTGAITIGGGTGVQTLNFGTGGTGAKTINIGTGGAANVITIGGGSGTVAINSGSWDISATGAITNATYEGLTITPTTGTLTIGAGKTLTVSNTLTFAGTDGTTMTFPGASDTVVGLAATQTLTNKTLTSPAINTATISGGTIDNAVIGGTTPAAGTFTALAGSTLTIGGGQAITKHLSATSFYDLSAPGDVPGCVETAGIAVTGAALGDTVVASMDVALPANYTINGYVSAADTVVVRLCQLAGLEADPDGTGATYRVDVWQHQD